MAFNKNINGFKNEYEFCNKLNNKKVENLDFLFMEFICDIYDNVSNNDIIKASIDKGKKKYDIVININGIIKRISIKKGIKNSVHVESIYNFIDFLIENKIPRKIIIEYLKYHYADETTNGTGKIRLSVEEYKKDNQDKIDLINKYINKDDILEKIVDRFILKGNISDEAIDVLIYGITNDFIWIKKDEIRDIILLKKDVYSTSVHFGPLTIQTLDRCLNYNSKYEKKRYCIQVKWYNLADDIIEYKNKSGIL